MTVPSDVLTSADSPPAETPPTLYIWNEMVKEYGNPLAVIDSPIPEPSIVAELDEQAEVAKEEDRPKSPSKPRPTKKRTDRPTWPKMPE